MPVLYVRKEITPFGFGSVEAAQWFKNGDHPRDECEMFIDSGGQPFQGEGHVVRYFRQPSISGETICKDCGKKIHDHGWLDTGGEGAKVSPGDFVLNREGGAVWATKPDYFFDKYEKVTN